MTTREETLDELEAYILNNSEDMEVLDDIYGSLINLLEVDDKTKRIANLIVDAVNGIRELEENYSGIMEG